MNMIHFDRNCLVGTALIICAGHPDFRRAVFNILTCVSSRAGFDCAGILPARREKVFHRVVLRHLGCTICNRTHLNRFTQREGLHEMIRILNCQIPKFQDEDIRIIAILPNLIIQKSLPDIVELQPCDSQRLHHQGLAPRKLASSLQRNETSSFLPTRPHAPSTSQPQ